ncbi:MAG: SMP-30/gluconolactonase/LRE family protein [Gaiellaceae bacterium]
MGVIVNNERILDLLDANVQAERIATGFMFSEGPIWHPDGYLLFSDIPASVRRRWTQDGGVVEVLRPANKGNGMTLDADLNLIVCEHKTSHVVRAKLNPDGTEASREVIASHFDGKELNSPNDVVVMSNGSVYFTDPIYGRWPVVGDPRERQLDFQGVYRVPGGDGEVELLVDDFDQPNGLCFSPDEQVLYVDDSGRHHIRRFTVKEDGTLSAGEVLIADIGSPEDFDAGVCDGMKCDEQGNIWVTGPAGIWVVSPEGEHLGTVEVPEHTSNLNWVGPGWNVLHVAASSSVYRIRCNVRGNRVSYMPERDGKEPATAEAGDGDRLFERGHAIGIEMFGAAAVEARLRKTTELTRDLDDYITRYCFGDIWAREGLTRKLRSMLTIAMLIALGRENELKVHVRGGLANGVTRDELREILLHAAAYCGIPAAVSAARSAQQVLAELDGEEQKSATPTRPAHE